MANNNNFLKDNGAIILLGGIVIIVGYDKVIAPILELLGLQKDKNIALIEKEQATIESAFNPNYWKNKNSKILTNAASTQFVNQIWDSVGWLNDDFERVFGIFKMLKTKSQVSYLAMKFLELKQKDLLTWLLGGGLFSYPADRFSSEEVGQIVAYVNNLPK
jgi:hypothetical protein